MYKRQVLTEPGIIHQMEKYSDNNFYPVSGISNQGTCDNCNNCHFMKLNTLEKLYNVLKNEDLEINLSEDLQEKAKKPIIKMLELS